MNLSEDESYDLSPNLDNDDEEESCCNENCSENCGPDECKIQDRGDTIVKLAVKNRWLKYYPEEKTSLIIALQSIVAALNSSDVEKKYVLINALKDILDENTYSNLVKNQSIMYGEAWINL